MREFEIRYNLRAPDYYKPSKDEERSLEKYQNVSKETVDLCFPLSGGWYWEEVLVSYE